MRHLFHHKNIALLATRGISRQRFAHVFVTNTLVDRHAIDNASESMFVFPLHIYPDATIVGSLVGLFREERHAVNLSQLFLRDLLRSLGLSHLPSSEDIFSYIYAVLHSPDYRSRYAEFLKIDFPRLPITPSLELFRDLARLGGELVALHLVEAPVQQALCARYDQPAKAWRYEVTPSHRLPVALTFTGPAAPIVEKVGWSDDTVWLAAAATKKGHPAMAGTIGFRGVPEAVWNFHIGGYQVCQKWLKDRKGRTLSADDLTHYHRVVIALYETIRLMKEIDEVIDHHGGWPDAFADGALHST